MSEPLEQKKVAITTVILHVVRDVRGRRCQLYELGQPFRCSGTIYHPQAPSSQREEQKGVRAYIRAYLFVHYLARRDIEVALSVRE